MYSYAKSYRRRKRYGRPTSRGINRIQRNISRRTINTYKADAALKIAKSLLKDREIKSKNESVDTVVGNTASYMGPTYYGGGHLLGLTSGIEDDQRVGNQISLKSLSVKGWLSPIKPATNGCGIIRLIFFIDRRRGCTDALPAWEEVFENKRLTSPYVSKGKNRGRFQVFYDKILPLTFMRVKNDDQTFTQNLGKFVNINLYKQWKGLKQRYKDESTTGNYNDIDNNAILWMAQVSGASDNEVANEAPWVTCRFDAKVSYTDN